METRYAAGDVNSLNCASNIPLRVGTPYLNHADHLLLVVAITYFACSRISTMASIGNEVSDEVSKDPVEVQLDQDIEDLKAQSRFLKILSPRVCLPTDDIQSISSSRSSIYLGDNAPLCRHDCSDLII
jgi:hypothetical protein